MNDGAIDLFIAGKVVKEVEKTHREHTDGSVLQNINTGFVGHS